MRVRVKARARVRVRVSTNPNPNQATRIRMVSDAAFADLGLQGQHAQA